MKKTTKIFIIVGILFLGLGLIGGSFIARGSYEDQRIRSCNGRYLLDKEHAYVIHPNIDYPEIDLKENTIYVLQATFSDEEKEPRKTAPSIMCHRVGSETTMDLTPYIGKPVYITGEFYIGKPLTVEPGYTGDQFFFQREVDMLRIDSLELVEDTK